MSELKTELAAVERKIQLSIKPDTPEASEDQTEKKQEMPKVQESILQIKDINLPRGI